MSKPSVDGFNPFKIIPSHSDESFCVVLIIPGFQNNIQFEGSYQECLDECNTLNKMLQMYLKNYLGEEQ